VSIYQVVTSAGEVPGHLKSDGMEQNIETIAGEMTALMQTIRLLCSAIEMEKRMDTICASYLTGITVSIV